MPKIRKRKRDGVEYGNWCVPLESGKLINLGTKNAHVANKRAALALQGRWPEDTAADAARASVPAVEVPEEKIQLPAAQPSEGVETSAAPAPVGHPFPVGAGAADSPPLGEAAAAAAAEVSGPGEAAPSESASEMGVELQKVLAGIGGGGSEGVELAEVVAGLHVGGAYAIANIVARRLKPPRQVPEIDERNILVTAAAAAWRVELRKWLSGLDTVEPWHVLVGVTLAAPVMALIGSKPVEEKQGRESTTPPAQG